jgi:hypothetical protein
MPTDTELREMWPDIPWLLPVEIRAFGWSQPRYACRLCIAVYGLRGTDFNGLYPTEEDALKHIRQFH